jgi:hypothetical protein
MSSISPDLLALATSTCVLAAMLVLALSKGMLSRAPLRQCPSCGRYVRNGGHCGCH